MADKELTIKIDGDSRGFKNELDGTGKKVKKFDKTLQKLAKGATIAFAGLATAAIYAVKKAADFEVIQVQFEVLTGNVNDAKFAMEELSDFSARTPFQFEEIAKASQKLLGFGFSVSELTEKMGQVGDVAAAVGANLGELTLIYGQVSAAGKLTGERLLQMQERAIPIGPAIAKTMGVAETEVRKLVTAGKVTDEVFKKAFATMTDEGGVAFEGMKKRSETLAGRISTLKDNFVLLSVEVGKILLPFIKQTSIGLTNITQDLKTLFNKDTVSEALVKQIYATRDAIKETEEDIKRIEDRGEGSILNFFAPDPKKLQERMEELEAKRVELNEQFKEIHDEEVAKNIETKDRRAAEALIRLKKAKAKEAKAIKDKEKQISKDFWVELQRRKKWDEINGREKIANLKSTLGTISSLSKANNKALAITGRASAIALAYMNTYQAANVALASAPPPFNFVLMGLTIAAGLANVASIVGVKLAEGGIVMPSVGGTRATIGEGGSAEAVIPLDDPEAQERMGIGGNEEISGTLKIIPEEFMNFIEIELKKRSLFNLSLQGG